MDITVLEDVGLTNAEAKIYLALLELGESKTGSIIDTTKLQSSTIYHTLGSLIKKGLVSFIHKGKIKYYRAESPESINLFLEDKKRKFNEILPELKEKEKKGKVKKSAKVFQGVKGIQQAYNDILMTMKKGEDYFFVQVPPHHAYDEQIMTFFRNYHLKRDEKGIKVRGITPEEARKAALTVHKGMKYSKQRFTKEFVPLGIVVYKNKIITLDWDQIPTAFVIESKTVADSYKKWFEGLWKRSNP